MLTPKNTRGRPVTKLCLALETFRRTDEGRARDAKAFLEYFFPQSADGARDRLFVHMPKEVRAGLLSSWGIRGKKSALRDDDDKVRTTVTDALAAGDIDAAIVEEGVSAEILTDWIPLEDWWSFWRGAGLPLVCVRKALALARELSLFDDRWFLEHLTLPAQRLQGTDVVCAALTKDQLVAWMNAVHASGDATPTGLVRALGWETILAKTAQDALALTLDSLARQIGLAPRDVATAKPAQKLASESGGHPKAADRQKAVIPQVAPGVDPSKRPVHGGSVEPVPGVIIELEPPEGLPSNLAESAPPPPPAPISSPPTARALFGTPTKDLPPMRPPAATLSGVGGPTPMFQGHPSVDVALPTIHVSAEDPAWAPPRAEPGDMGWDLVHGIKRPMSTNVQPRYNFDDDDEPTSEISMSLETGQS
ncbi:MAG TPA: hypothetical protein VM925_10475 [Labilithrix sp.]|nr:hypothetical protein [Labilithrix sp.]